MIEFSKKERDVIAEYIFSYETDVLIKPDAIKLVELLHNHNLIDNKEKWTAEINYTQNSVATRLNDLIKEKLPAEQIKSIMDEYYGG